MRDEEKVYQFNEYVLGYDKGLHGDRSCLTISKTQNNTLYVMASLYDGSADVISMIMDDFNKRLNKIKEYLKQVHYETKHGILSSNNLIYENIERLCDGKDLIKESKND